MTFKEQLLITEQMLKSLIIDGEGICSIGILGIPGESIKYVVQIGVTTGDCRGEGETLLEAFLAVKEAIKDSQI